MEIVAILDMSAGNESVGEMWTETCVFSHSAPIENILTWAQTVKCRYNNAAINIHEFKGNLRITVAQRLSNPL